MQNKWIVIINPNAGNKKGFKDWEEISHLLVKAGFDFKSIFTEGKHHATAICKEYIEAGYQNIIAIGGDGTLNEVMNGIFKQKKFSTLSITLGIIPLGTGNDWCRTFFIPYNYSDAISVIKEKRLFQQDVGIASYYREGKQEKRYFANIAGIGFDAVVVQSSEKGKKKNNKFAYLISLFANLLGYQPVEANVKIDNTDLKGKVFSINAGICKYKGGGMMPTPNAHPGDGEFDMTVIINISKFEVIRNLRRLYNGSFIKNPKVKSIRGKSVHIDAFTPLFMEADGESLGESPFELSIMPQCLNVIVGKEYMA